MRSQSKCQAEIDLCNSLMNQHTTRYVNANVAVQQYIQRSLSYPREVASFRVDSMDNRKSIIPRLLEKSKTLTLEHRLASKLTGCITETSLYPENRKVQFFYNHGKNELSMLLV